MKTTHTLLASVAVLFGLLTIFAGSRVLLGSDPGYTVYRPLLIYNTVMGFVYAVAGIVAWRNIRQGLYLTALIFVLNLIVLAAIFFLYAEGSAVAVDSLRAMSLRTLIWFALFTGFYWLYRRNKLTVLKPGA